MGQGDRLRGIHPYVRGEGVRGIVGTVDGGSDYRGQTAGGNDMISVKCKQHKKEQDTRKLQ